MAYATELRADLVSAMEAEFGSEAKVRNYRGELATEEGMRKLVGMAARSDQIMIQYEGGEYDIEETTFRVTDDREQFSIIVAASNERNEEDAEDEVLALVDRARGAAQGRVPTGSGFAVDEPWHVSRAALQLSVPGLTVYSMFVDVTLKRDHDA